MVAATLRPAAAGVDTVADGGYCSTVADGGAVVEPVDVADGGVVADGTDDVATRWWTTDGACVGRRPAV